MAHSNGQFNILKCDSISHNNENNNWNGSNGNEIKSKLGLGEAVSLASQDTEIKPPIECR